MMWKRGYWHTTLSETYHLLHTSCPRCNINILVRMCQYLERKKLKKNINFL